MNYITKEKIKKWAGAAVISISLVGIIGFFIFTQLEVSKGLNVKETTITKIDCPAKLVCEECEECDDTYIPYPEYPDLDDYCGELVAEIKKKAEDLELRVSVVNGWKDKYDLLIKDLRSDIYTICQEQHRLCNYL